MGRAGVVLGGLRERREPAAEAPGGREQGRGFAPEPRSQRRVGCDRRRERARGGRRVPGGGRSARAVPKPWRWRASRACPGVRWRGELAQLAERPAAAAPAGRAGQGRGPRRRPRPALDASAASRAHRKLRLDGRARVRPLEGRRPVAGRAAGQGAAHAVPTPRRFDAPPDHLRRPEASGLICGVCMASAGSRIMSDKASLSDIATPRQAGRIIRHKQRDKAPLKIHHAPVIRADLDLLADPPPDLGEGVPAPLREARASEAERGENPGTARFRRRRRSRPGRGRAEGQGRAIPCSPPAPGSRFSTPSCAPTRPPPERCALASRFRAPPPPPKSCASTPTKPRCATSASPSATRSGPRRTSCRSGAMAPAGRPASTRPDLRRGGAAGPRLRTRTASHRA